MSASLCRCTQWPLHPISSPLVLSTTCPLNKSPYSIRQSWSPSRKANNTISLEVDRLARFSVYPSIWRTSTKYECTMDQELWRKQRVIDVIRDHGRRLQKIQSHEKSESVKRCTFAWVTMHLIFPESIVIRVHFVLIVWVYFHSNLCKNTHLFCNRMRFGRSRSSKVADFGSAYATCHCDYGPILHRFWDTATYWLKLPISPTLYHSAPPPAPYVPFGILRWS